MYRTGIWRPNDLERRWTVLGKARQYSYSLLRTTVPAATADIARFETVIRTVGTSSGIFRTTYPSRFDDLDSVTERILERIFPAAKPLVVHDLGASDCFLSMRWAKRIFSSFPNARVIASDIMQYFTEAVWRSGESYILEPNGTPIQYTKVPFVVSVAAREPVALPLNALVRALSRRRLDNLRLAIAPVAWEGVPDYRVLRQGEWTFRQIPLVHPSVLEEPPDERFSIRLLDAFSPSPLKCDVIRAMNLYQAHAIPIQQIHRGIAAALDSVNEGGLFIAGKTVNGKEQQNHVTIFQMTDGQPRVIETLGHGFDFDYLVDAT